MESEHLTTSDLAALLGLTQRRAQQLMAALEGLGFALERDRLGARLIPRPLALLVARVREEGKGLEALLTMPEARPYLRASPSVALGEMVGVAFYTLRQVRKALALLGASLPSWPPRWAWQEAGLADPREEGDL